MELKKLVSKRGIVVTMLVGTLVGGGVYSYLTIRSIATILGLGGFTAWETSTSRPVPERPRLHLTQKYLMVDTKGGSSTVLPSQMLCKWDLEDAKEFLSFFRKYEDTICTLAKAVSRDCEEDWSRDVENLYQDFPEGTLVDWWAPCVRFLEVRNTSNLLCILARYAFEKGEHEKGLRILRTNVSVLRQLISFGNKKGGVVLIESMIGLAVLNNTTKVLNLCDFPGRSVQANHARGLEAKELLVQMLTLLEDMDDISRLVCKGMATERSGLRSFLRLCERAETKRYGASLINHQAQWIQDVENYFYPDVYVYTGSLPAFQASNEKYVERVEKLAEEVSTPWFFVQGISSPRKTAARYLMAIMVPNTSKAYEKECAIRSRLRSTYVKTLSYCYTLSERRTAASVSELQPEGRSSMMVDPLTGKAFVLSEVLKDR